MSNGLKPVVAAVAALSSFVLTTPLLADSRFFSVKTDRPDVTVEQASANGKPLTVAGKSGSATFFRIENASGPIPCVSHFEFVKSNGQHAESDFDLCAANWELTLPAPVRTVGWLNPSPSTSPTLTLTPASPPPPDGQSEEDGVGSDRTVTISTDDPSIGITQVFLEKQPVEITGGQGNSVEITVPSGPAGINCQRDLGLKLMDGRTIARHVNICLNNFSVLVMLADDSTEVTPPPRVATGPTPTTPASPGFAAPVTPGPDETPVWSFNTADGNVTLVYGIPETDASELTASCAQGSRQATVELTRSTVPDLDEGAPVRVTLSAGAFTKAYDGVGSPYSDEAGGSYPQLSIAANDPLWTALIAESQLIVSPASGVPPYVISLKGSAAPTRQFLALCSPQVFVGSPQVGFNSPKILLTPLAPIGQPEPPSPQGNEPGENVVYECNDGTELDIFFNEYRRTATVTESGQEPQVLAQVPSEAEQLTWMTGPYRLVGTNQQLQWMRPFAPPRSCGPAG